MQADDGGSPAVVVFVVLTRPPSSVLAAEVPVDPDGLRNWARGDVDAEGNGRGPRLLNDGVTVHAAARGTQRIEILIRRPFRKLRGDRGAFSGVNGDAL